ncbi:unnamed protein product [Lasius platythorax]|uniref:Uncharacterized protein n=1 Tax=Lasius platythorax TaxID=488582 RepID=A0AAV2P1X6_9HYME
MRIVSYLLKWLRHIANCLWNHNIAVVGILHGERFLATGGIESWMGLGYLLRYLCARLHLPACPSVDFRHVNSPTLRLASCDAEPVRSRDEPGKRPM